MDFRLPGNFLEEEQQNNSYENTPHPAASKNSSPQLLMMNYSMYNIAETSSFDADLSSHNQNLNPQSSNNNYNPEIMKLKLEYKSKRTVRSQTPAVRPKLVLNTKFQNLFPDHHKAKNEEDLDERASPPTKREDSNNYHRSFSVHTDQQYNYKTVQPHSSYITSQKVFFNGLSSSPGGEQEKFYRRTSTKDPKNLKNILPVEKSKQYPAPNKETGPEFCRKVPHEKANSAKFASKIYYELDASPNKSQKDSSGKGLKPTSPLKKSRMSLEAASANTPNSNPSNLDGNLQFRAKKFANKKEHGAGGQ